MRIWGIIIALVAITTTCNAQDFVGNQIGDTKVNKKTAFALSGKLIGSREETRIVVTIPGDSILDVSFNIEIYTITLQLRPIQIIDFYNHQGRQKTLILINATEKSEVLTFDVDFNQKKNMALVKYRTTDKEGSFIEQSFIP